jgi:uncharacterized protein (TIGR04255 family)
MPQQEQTRSPFPSSPRVVYGRNPLVEVICQLRFPTILEIAAKEPADFQERVRESYPLYKGPEAGVVPRELAEVLSRLPIQMTAEDNSHKFAAAESERLITLARDFVAVTEKKYRRWEQFRDEIVRAKDALEEIYRPAFYTRIGLRYQDVIDKATLGLDGEPWSELINPSLAGLLGSRGLREIVREVEGVAILDIDEVVTGASVTVRHGLASVENRRVYLIDVDCFTAGRSNLNDVIGILDSFNRLAGDLFRWAITAKLTAALEPEPIT